MTTAHTRRGMLAHRLLKVKLLRLRRWGGELPLRPGSDPLSAWGALVASSLESKRALEVEVKRRVSSVEVDREPLRPAPPSATPLAPWSSPKPFTDLAAVTDLASVILILSAPRKYALKCTR